MIGQVGGDMAGQEAGVARVTLAWLSLLNTHRPGVARE